MDRLAWDLGDPSGTVRNVSAALHNFGAGIPGLNTNFTHFHPMKGPMTTQTLQDIIGKEPHHWRGDRNGLQNLPGAPMLDDIAGLLLVLGLGYSLWRSRDPRYALLPLWLGLTLLGGILSLDFEAPQSLRANGALGRTMRQRRC